MKFPLVISIASALGIALTGAQAQSAATGALGYYSQCIPAGNSLVTVGLVAKSDFSGAMTGMTSGSPNSTIEQAGAGWSEGDFSNHYVEIREGAWEGLILDIVANGTDSVVVEGELAAFAGLAGTEKYTIRAHATLDTIFPGGGGLSTGFADFVTVFESDGAQKLFANNGGTWVEFPSFAPGGGQVVYPGQGILVATSAKRTVVIGGNDLSTVKTGKPLVPIYAGVVNLVGLVNPLVAFDSNDPIFPSTSTLGEMGFLGGPTPFSAFADFLELFSEDGSLASGGTFASNGGSMIGFPSFADATNTPVTIGQAFSVAPSSTKYYQAPDLLP